MMTDEASVKIEVEVNGEARSLAVPARMTLADAIRDRLGLTGTHLGCEHGVCGSCTVLLDDRSVRSCLTLAAQADGRRVTTIEGLSAEELSPLQRAFAARGGLQCGFCTPGFIVASTELLRDTGSPDEATIRSALSGNTCRCTGYETIIDAVLESAGRHPVDESPRWPDVGPSLGEDALDAPPLPRRPSIAADEDDGPPAAISAAAPSDRVPSGPRRPRTALAAAGGLLAAGAVGAWLWTKMRVRTR